MVFGLDSLCKLFQRIDCILNNVSSAWMLNRFIKFHVLKNRHFFPLFWWRLYLYLSLYLSFLSYTYFVFSLIFPLFFLSFSFFIVIIYFFSPNLFYWFLFFPFLLFSVYFSFIFLLLSASVSFLSLPPSLPLPLSYIRVGEGIFPCIFQFAFFFFPVCFTSPIRHSNLPFPTPRTTF